MRILLIIVFTITFLFLVFSALLSIYMVSETCAVLEHKPNFLSWLGARVFGNWIVDIIIWFVLAGINLFVILGPLMKVEDPVTRTVLHLGIIGIQVMVILAITVLVLSGWVVALLGVLY